MHLKSYFWIIPVAVLALSNYYSYRSAEQARQAMAICQQENQTLLDAQGSLRKQIAMLRDDDTQIANLTDGAQKVITRVYHNVIRQETALDLSGIPTPPEKQYLQAWAIVKGERVNLGMVNATAVGSWQFLPFHADAEGFIISQELMKEGNTRPVLELINGMLQPAK